MTGTAKKVRLFFLVMAIAVLSACGGIHYTWENPDVGEFHPDTIIILPLDMGPNTEATAPAEDIITETLEDTGRFSAVRSADEMRARFAGDRDTERIVTTYIEKFKTLSYSDPALSARIGSVYESEALFFVTVDFWEYTVQDDEKVGKVGFSVSLVDAATGIITWRASHTEVDDYLIIKPDLDDLAEDVAETIMDEMPE